MPKIKKLKRKKKFRANVNRKRLRNKLNKLPDIECKQIKEAWESKRSTVKNLAEMGLAYDPNQVLKIPNVKREMLKFVNERGEEVESDAETAEEHVPRKLHVVQSLEEEAKCPRARLFRLPNNEVLFATYMMDKHGDDYKAMVRDRKNHYQLTWRQIKAKIKRFKSVPEQYAEYLVKTGEIVLDDPAPLKKIKPPTVQEPIEKKTSSKPSRRKRKKAKQIGCIWQEESVVEDEAVDDFDTSKAVGSDGEDKVTSDQTSGEKKLKLFPDDDESKDDSDAEMLVSDSLDDSDVGGSDQLISDSEDGDDAKDSVSVGKDNNDNKKKPVKLGKSKNSKQKSKKSKVR